MHLLRSLQVSLAAAVSAGLDPSSLVLGPTLAVGTHGSKNSKLITWPSDKKKDIGTERKSGKRTQWIKKNRLKRFQIKGMGLWNILRKCGWINFYYKVNRPRLFFNRKSFNLMVPIKTHTHTHTIKFTRTHMHRKPPNFSGLYRSFDYKSMSMCN